MDAASNTPLELQVDAAPITEGIDSALGAVDTSSVESALGGVSDSLSQASEQATKTGGAFDGILGPAIGLATGKLGEAGTAARTLVPELAGATAATAALAAGGHELFSGALEQATAIQRLKTVFGDLAPDVEKLHAGGFNLLTDDLSGLAQKVGANVDPLRIFIAKMGELGQSSGHTAEEGARTGETITALAARISAVNPTLGTADELVNRLGLTLGRGGFRLAQYGISLTAAQVNAEALAETHKTAANELSIFEKQTAGANLAVQQFGGNLQEQIDKGADQPIVKLRSLKIQLEETLKAAGAPLVGPGLDALKAITPIIEELARVLGTVLSSGLQVAVPLLQGLSAIVTPLASAFTALPGPIRLVAEALALLKFTSLGESAGVLTAALSTGGLSAALGSVAPLALVAGAGLLAYQHGLDNATQATKNLDTAAITGHGLATFDRQVQSAAQHTGLTEPFSRFADVLGLVDLKAQAASKAFTQLAKADPTAAAQLIQTMSEAGRNTDVFRAILDKIDPAARAAASGINATAGALNGMTPAAQAADAALGAALGRFQSTVSAQLGLESAQTSLTSAIEATSKAHVKQASSAGTAGKSAIQMSLDIRSAQLGIESAQFGVEDATKRVQDAQQKLNDLYTVSTAEARAIESAQRGLINAEQQYTDATNQVAAAQQHLLDVTRAATQAEADKAERDAARARLGEADARVALEDAQEKLTLAQRDAQRAQGRSATTQEAAAEALAAANRDVQKAQLDVADATDRTAEAQAKANDVTDGTVGTAKDAADAQTALEAAQRGQANAADGVTQAQQALTDAQAATQVSSRDLSDAQEELAKAEEGQRQAVLTLDESHQHLVDAQKNTGTSAGAAATAADSYSAALDRQKTAAFALVDQLYKFGVAQAEENGHVTTAKEKWDIYTTALNTVASTIGLDSELRVRLHGLARDAEIKGRVTVDTSQAVEALRGVGALTTLLTDVLAGKPNVVHGSLFDQLANNAKAASARMAGGPFDAFEPLMVGEAGPERVIFSQPGTVIPNDKLGGSQITQQITVNQVADDPHATAFVIAQDLGYAATR